MKKRYSKLFYETIEAQEFNFKYLIPMALLILCINITSCIVGQNFIQLGNFSVTIGMLIYPWTFILVAVITEVYGFKASRYVIYSITSCMLFMVVVIYGYAHLQAHSAFIGDITVYNEFQKRLAYLLFISAMAYLISEYCNAKLLSKLRIFTRGTHLFFCVFLSTSVAILIDTMLIFQFFTTKYTNLSLITYESFLVLLFKIGYETTLIPILWFFVKHIKSAEGKAFDTILPMGALPYSSVTLMKYG